MNDQRSGPIYFVISLRCEIGPLDRAALRSRLEDGSIAAGDQVRNAFGRPLGTVAEVLARRSQRHATQLPEPAPDVPPADAPTLRKGSAWLIQATIFASAGMVGAGLAAWLVLGGRGPDGSAPPAPAPAPAPAAPPAALGSASPESALAPSPAPAVPEPATSAAAAPPAPPLAAGAPPAGWKVLNIDRKPGQPEPTVGSDGVWRFSGQGQDIYGTKDQFRFLAQQVDGDCTLSIRLLEVGKGERHAKVGLMLRSDDTASSAFAMVSTSPIGGLQMLWRSQAGAKTINHKLANAPKASWLRICRRQGSVIVEHSPDGTAWYAIAPAVEMPGIPERALLGIAIASNSDNPQVMRFDRVSLTRP